MDQRVRKLNHRLQDADLAAKLVAAGLDTPRKIKAASNEAIEAIPTIGKTTRQAIQAAIG